MAANSGDRPIHRYTAFPNLCVDGPPAPNSGKPADNMTEFRVPCNLSAESVVTSWAQLLRGYVGIDGVVFRVDSETVGVNFLDGSVEYLPEGSVQIPEDEGAGQRCSGVYFQTAPAAQWPQIYLRVHLPSSTISMVASTAIVPKEHIESLVSQLLYILSSSNTLSASTPSVPYSGGLSILNSNPTKLPGPELLHQLIAFGKYDNSMALDFLHADGKERVSYSYKQLDCLSTQFAVTLLEHLPSGGGGSTVPVLLPPSPELYVAMIGILKAGAAFVPLNLDAPMERIRFITADVGAAAIVTQSAFSDAFTWEGCPPVVFTDGGHAVSERRELELPTDIKPSALAYIMYTSGTTGTPKGVTISHSAATQSLLAHDRHIPALRRFLQFAAPTFDVFVFEMFFPLFRGGTLVGCDRGRLLANLPAAINELNIDVAELTPTVVGELIVGRGVVPGLKVLLTIGEMLTRHVVDQFGDGVLQGMYGPTEAAIHCTLATGFKKSWKVGDIGVPLDTVSAFILSTETNPDSEDVRVLPLGWVGELAVGGYQLADGYLNQPELTREAFIESKLHGRLYRTGDRARVLPDGRIECLGRVTAGQVKLRGQRIELGEVEQVVMRVPGVKVAIASVLESKLVVYVGGGLEKSSVYATCKRWLPKFMVPGDIVVFDELPRLPSGKVDRERLNKEYLGRTRVLSGDPATEKLGDMDQVVVETVGMLLGVRPSKQGSLVAQGLDSIQAIRLVTALRSEGFRIEVADVLNADCVEGIATAMSPIEIEGPNYRAAETVTARFKAVREAEELGTQLRHNHEIEDIIPCTSVQEAMLAETAKDSKAYCNWILLELPVKFCVSEIETAFRRVIDSNEILRTGFTTLNGGFAQVIWKHSRPGQFSEGSKIQREWEISCLEQLLEPQFEISLVKGEDRSQLIVQLHHAVYDGWCWEQILSDFSTSLGRSPLPVRPQFRQVVGYELSRSKDSESSRRSWVKALEGVSVSRLPSFHSHTDVRSGVFTEALSLRDSRERYETAARRMGVSPQVIIQTAWAYLLSFYTGSSDVVFGTVASGRTIAVDGIEDILGPTIHTLPVRVQLGQGKILREVVSDIHASNRLLLEHSRLSLREIRKACGIEGVLFDSLLIWQQTLRRGEERGLVRQVESRDHLEMPLLIEVEPRSETINVKVTYQHALLPHAQVGLLLRQLDQLVVGIVSQPGNNLDLLLGFLQEDVLSVENPYPSPSATSGVTSLAELVELTAAAKPHTFALEFASDITDGVPDSVKLSYAELNTSANKLAHHLISLGVLPGELVCVCMEKSPELYISILAILKTGAGYLPLTPETPKGRVAQILENAEVKLCLADDLLVGEGIPEGVRVVRADTVELQGFIDTNPVVERSGGELAYAVFTSGSTGVPKGVLIENVNIVDNLLALQGLYPTKDDSKILQFCSVSFDVSVFDIFFAWSTGICLCSGTKDFLLRDLVGAINALDITHLSMTPTVAALINPEDVPRVEFLVTAGEAVTQKVFQNWAGKGLFQGYGPSETVNICTVRPSVRDTDHINNIGPPLSNTSAFVVLGYGEEFRLAPRGGVGEFCFGGTQVGRGYLQMPELTNQKFISHPKYGRLYRSGDTGRMLIDGSLEFVGRQDDQVKIRGYRIELGEINSALLRSGSVIDTITITLRGYQSDGYQLVAFVILERMQSESFSVVENSGEAQKIVNELFSSLVGILPSYMIPTAIIPLTRLPMTTQGKIDKTRLRSLYFDLEGPVVESYTESGSANQSERGWTTLERIIADIIAGIARVTTSEVGRTTSIFRLGLDSISVIQLSSGIAKAGHIRLDVSQIMRNPTPAALAALLIAQRPVSIPRKTQSVGSLEKFAAEVESSVLGQLGCSADDVERILPCTPLQEAMLSQKEGSDPSLYYNHTVLSLGADPARIKDAWAVMVGKQDIMRTSFCVTSHPRHAFAQVVLKYYQLPWAIFQAETAAEIPGLIGERIATISESLEITKPPYAFSLFQAPTKTTLVMHFHHSLYDGFAMNLLLDDVRRAYHGQGLPARGSFEPFLEYIENFDLAAADDFWRKFLDRLEPSSFPDLTGKATAARGSLRGMASAKALCSRSLASIDEGCRKLSTSLLALGQTAWARLLSVYSGETDLCFGNVVSGRTIPIEGVEDIIFPCFNTVPIRIRMTPGATNESIMESLRLVNADVLPFQLTPLRRIMATVRSEGQPLFDTLFILHQAHQLPSAEELWKVEADYGEMDFSIVVELVPDRKTCSLEINLHFRRDVLLEEDAHVLLQQLDDAIVSSLDEPLRPALDFRGFDLALLSYANSRPVDIPGDGPGFLHSEFECRSQENPSRRALEYLDKDGEIIAWTFEELNRAANQVAHYLLSNGVRRDEAVPLCLEKSPLFYICVLGVLKAGAAFTPIDPSLPQQRKLFMLGELGAKIALVTEVTARDLAFLEGVKLVDAGAADAFSPQPTVNPKIEDLSIQCLAYRLYTSGSTGQPKAVSVEIGSAVQTIRASKSIIPWSDKSRLLQFAATTFDMCYYDCFMAWSYGFTLCSADKSHLLGDLEGTIQALRASILDLTPSVASTLRATNLPGIELLYCIGEAMPQKLAVDWHGRCVNSYGPTEAAMCCTISPTRKDITSSNIGKPFPTASFFILSHEGRSVIPIFGSGELCIGGPQLAREYHNNPERTANSFIDFEGSRVYRTGDLVRMLANGTFVFIGRTDDQVKIRGLRVELDEINSVLRGSDPLVKDAATIVTKRNGNTKEQLVTFLALQERKHHETAASVLNPDSQLYSVLESSRNAASSKLPRYMVPGVVLIINHIPLSAAGKIDKRALATLFNEQDIQSFASGTADTQDEDEKAWTEDERKIRDAFAQISQVPVEQISRHSTIYEIGLDSISASQVAMQLQGVGLRVSVLDILERPSIAKLYPILGDTSPGPTSPNEGLDVMARFADRFLELICKETGLSGRDITSVYPCTPVQEGMLSQFIRSNGTLYFNHTIFKLPSNTNLARLKSSWEVVFKSLDILRTGFVGIDDSQHSFAMIVHKPGLASLPWFALSTGKDPEGSITERKRLNSSFALERLHLPPWMLNLFRVPDGEDLLMLSAHHAMYDAQSLGKILNAVSCYYSGQGHSPCTRFSGALCEIVKHYTDDETIADDQVFWTKRLEGSTISRFPNLCPLRVKGETEHVSSITAKWSLSEIEKACRRLGVSVSATGQAAWARILSAYLGEGSVTMGVVMSGRSGIAKSQDVVFPFVVTLPSLCSLTGTNRELVLSIQGSNSQTLKHQHTPLRLIQKWLGHPEQSLFDTIFVYQKFDFPKNTSALQWVTMQEDAFVDYSISLELESAGNDSLLIRATCKDNIIPQEQTELLLQQFQEAFIEILEVPDASSSDFHKFPAPLLSCTPAKEDEIPTSTHLLHKFVEGHRRLTANNIALEFATSIMEGYVVKETWTYAQLDDEGNKVANYLLDNGVKTGDRVGICFEKCPEASFAILGILKSGCAFVALDYSAPVDRKSFIITDSGAKLVLTMDKYMGELSKLNISAVSLESDARVKTSSSKTPEIPDLKPNDLCYCLYTSGTTGTPKGCEITHENAVQATLAFQRLFSGHWDAESRCLQFASFHFDVSVLEQFWSWSVGICVTSAPRDLIFQDLALTIRELRITHLDLTPSLAALIKPEDVPSLCKGVFITGGEQLKQEILDAWGETGCLYNGYGPTEVTIGCTMYPRVPATGKPSNIGPQFDNVGSFVLAPGTDKPLLRGAIGELCVSGKLVGRGYLNRPSLTQERFPYLETLGLRVYRTGDFVRILHDNTFDFAGRVDDQIKLRGQRLEIGEINETLKQATSRARAVATLVLRHPKQQKDQLVSFVELETRSYAGRPDIRVLDSAEEYSEIIRTLADACKRKLPAYMVPTHFLPISAIPLSVNNKVDNKKLKELYQKTSLEILQRISRREDPQEGEWSEAEREIRDAVARLANLEIPAIKRSATVFELGLDSVSIVGLARQLKRAGFLGSSVSLIMQHPTLGELAAELTKDVAKGSYESVIAESVKQNLVAFATKNVSDVCGNLSLDPSDIELIAPCTALQEGMIARFLGSEKPLYYNSFPMMLRATTDVNVVRDAWHQVIASTGILRTCFCETPDGYAQVVLRDSEVPWEEISVPTQDIQVTISGRMGKHANTNRDLHRVPLYFLLLRTPEGVVLVLNIFHALYDGNSLPLILGDVQRAYHGKFKPRSRQFTEVIGNLLSVDIGGAREFWKKALAKSTPSRFPRLSGVSSTDTDYMIELKSGATVKGVEGICKKVGCTPQAIFLAAWASVISRYLGPQPIFGVVVSGRSIPLDDIESIIGPLFNTIPFTLSPQSVPTWENLIQQAHAFFSRSIPYHHTPLHLVNKWMHAPVGKPLFDSLFVYQRSDDRDLDLPPSLWEAIDSTVTADYPLALEVEQNSSGFSFSIVSKESLMAKTNSSELLEGLEDQVQNILRDPTQKPSAVATVQPAQSPSPTSVTKELGGDQFSWGPEADILRQTISALAEVEESAVTPDSSVFELGLDSIEAIKLSSRLRQQSINLSVSDIMRNPTIRKLDLFLRTLSTQPEELMGQDSFAEFETRIRGAWNPRTHNWIEDEIEAIYPTTPLQEAMIAHTLASDYKLYFNHDILVLEPWVDLRRLRSAWATVARHSEILRTTFFNATEILPGSLCTFGQLVHKQSELSLGEVTMAPDGDLDKALKAVMQQALESADMMKEPPFKITVVHRAKARYLVLSMSHALYDGWSIGLLHDDVRSAYHGQPTKRPSCRPILKNIYKGNRDDTERFWRQALTGASATRLPAIRTGTFQPATHRVERLSALPLSGIRSFCKQMGVTVQSLGQMCWALVLAHFLGEPDVMFGTVVSGRDFDSADEIMFPAMNTIPVRASIRGTYKEMLQDIQKNSADVMKYQYTPLRQIQRLVDSNGQCLFDTLFIYQRSYKVLDRKHKALWGSADVAADVEYNVCIEMEPSGDGLRWRTACKTTVLRPEKTETLLRMLDSLMVDIVGNPDRSAILHHESGMSFGNLPVEVAQRSSRMGFLKGRWVDLGNVESVAKASNADIQDSGAVIVETNGENLLALFIKCGDSVSVQSLAASLRQCLPHWSMPSFIIPTGLINRITANNRIDRADLTSKFSKMAPARRELCTVRSIDEWTPLEVTFREVISKVSSTPEAEIGRHQTIFHLGLDSISAILLSNELRKRSIVLSVTEILQAATIGNMAAVAKTTPGRAPQAGQDPKTVLENSLANIRLDELLGGIGREAIERVFPATAGQHYMLSAWRNSGFKLFMPTFPFKCRRLGISCVLSGWESLVRQEPILRTTFIATQSEDTPLIQLVLRSPQAQCEWYESSSSKNDTLVRFLVSQEQKKPVNLSLPPVRLCILNTPAETLLFLTIHHALYDGVSLPLLLAKFEGFLNNCTGRLPTPGPEDPGFPAVVAFMLTRNAQNQRDFWTKRLSWDIPVSTLVPEKHPDAGPDTRTEVYRPGALGEVNVLEGHCRREGVSLQSVFLAAFAIVYAHWCSIRDGPLKRGREVTFGLYVSNRHLPILDLDSLAAPTLNFIPLRVRSPVSTNVIENVIDLAHEIQEELVKIGDPENTVVPLWQIEKWTGTRVDCFFNYLKVPEDLKRSTAVNTGDRIALEEFKVDVEAEDRTLDGSEFKGNASMDYIKTNLDVEVAVRGDSIDIGVFSSTRYLDQDDAKLAIDQICAIVKAGLVVP